MGDQKKSVYTIVLTIILVAALAMLFFENVNAITGHVTSITGHASQASSISNVTIQAYFSVQWSNELDTAIVFEDVLTLPVTDQNARENYGGAANETLYWARVHEDSNRKVDFCLKASGDLNNTADDRIGLGNETYATNVTSTDLNNPNVTLQIPMTTVYNKSATNIDAGETNYYRFWLDIPAAQPPGVYTNDVDFRGVAAGTTNATCS